MISTLQKLGKQLQQEIINSETKLVSLQKYQSILQKYNGNDWLEFIEINPHHYNRCKIYDCDYFDMYVLTWNNNQESKIHNHADNGCLSKTLLGSYQEIFYDPSDLTQITNTINNKTDDINFIDNKIGYHKIKNNDEVTVTLHIYSPPNFKTKFF